MKLTKQDYAADLNEIGVPEDDKRSNGGRIPDHAQYGDWLRRNDPIAFTVGFQDWERETLFRLRSGNRRPVSVFRV
jgi:hypothetical protein